MSQLDLRRNQGYSGAILDLTTRSMEYPLKASIAGVILAGGRATRMGGQDKGLLPLAGEPMAARAVRILRPQVRELLINANRNLEAYRALGCTVVADDDTGAFFGPLAGMLAALEATSLPQIITVPCDSPLLPEDYVRRMQQTLEQNGAELCVASDGNRLQPVFSLLKGLLRESLSVYLAAGGRKIDRWFARHDMAVADFSDHPAMFRNVNTPQDLIELEGELLGS